MYGVANENDRVIAEEPAVLARRTNFSQAIESIAGYDGDAVYEELLSALERDGSASGVRIVSVKPSTVPQKGDLVGAAVMHVTIELEGTFRSLIAMFAAMSTSHGVLGVSGFSLRAGPGTDTTRPALLAEVDANVYTLHHGWEMEVSRETTAAPR